MRRRGPHVVRDMNGKPLSIGDRVHIPEYGEDGTVKDFGVQTSPVRQDLVVVQTGKSAYQGYVLPSREVQKV